MMEFLIALLPIMLAFLGFTQFCFAAIAKLSVRHAAELVIDKNLPPLKSTIDCTAPRQGPKANLTIGPDGLPVASDVGAARAAQNETRIEDRDQTCEASARDVGMSVQDE